MKSKAAIAKHPVHPMFVVVPIGSWFATLVGDIAYMTTHNAFWYQFAFYTMLIGLLGALGAAVFGFIDYFGVRMSDAGRQVARTHMFLNLGIVAAYAVNLWLRWDNAALIDASPSRWQAAFWLEILSYATLAVSGWLGGELSYKHKVGVSEHDDPAAAEIGMQEPVEAPRAPSRNRGLQG
jgi:uncharacterized membrane protein